jgi:hypothetical protein
MPRPQRYADLSQIDASPTKRLVAAMFHLAVTDARAGNGHSAQARAFLRNEPLVRWWIDLVGFPDTTYGRLLVAAGLEEAS